MSLKECFVLVIARGFNIQKKESISVCLKKSWITSILLEMAGKHALIQHFANLSLNTPAGSGRLAGG